MPQLSLAGRGFDAAVAAGALCIGAVAVLALLRKGFAGVNLHIGD